ncbi:FAD-binding oxidoreductase [Psychromarinibacter sp. C21-152]|uniref:FAD-binding oxidoreductase n=1 Tax=Psychromarinibacter sediminicola TaxID=3033385 RepID=A0AAE3TAC4_9RHOB|nr:FAD-binding oxidoreductase [Psychromarinibacter sediminicola]MDF0601854.1 FAD-binding oxidoreductase [Psychromarinibacter sediminicola]
MTTADVIVIGGGIAGISAAARIAERGMTVVVLEGEDQLGYHSTGRSAAIFIRNYGNATLRALNAAAAPFMEAPEGVSETSLLSPRGELLVATEDEMPALDKYAAGSSGLDRLTPDEAVDLVPILRREAIAGAVIERDAQDIDVDRMLSGFAKMLRRAGGEIRTGAQVRRMRHGDGLWKVETRRDRLAAPVVVNAAGAWAADVAHLAGAKPIPLQALRRSAAILPAPDGHDVSAWPLFGSAAENWYAKPEAGKLMVSPADEDEVDPHDAWADDMVLAEGLDRYERAVTVPLTRVETSWAGLRTFANDRTPLVGFDAWEPGFFWLAGQGGYGVQTAPALAALTAALVAGEAPALAPDVVTALDPSRLMV